MAAPRIGRADRLAQLEHALAARATTPAGWGRPSGAPARPALSVPAITRLLTAPAPPADPPPPSRQAMAEAAGRLVTQLEPLPNALHEIATRISRHCANTGRDAELARMVDGVRGRTWELFLAIRQLRAAGRGASDAGSG